METDDRRPRRARPGRGRHGLAAGVDAGPRVRRASRCPYGAECFAEASRARAREADIVVTNHSLLAVDMLAGRHIVPPHKLLIIDEAHELADRVSSARPGRADRRSDRAGRPAGPAADRAGRWPSADRGRRRARRRAGRHPGRPASPPACRRALHEAVHAAGRGRPASADAIGEIKADDPDPVRKQQAKAALDDLSTTAQRLLEESDDDVAWVEKPTGTGRRALVVAPLSVAGHASPAPLRRAHRGRDLGHAGPRRPVRHRGPLARAAGRRPAVPAAAGAIAAPRPPRRGHRRRRRRPPGRRWQLARRRLPVRLRQAGHPVRRRAPAPAQGVRPAGPGRPRSWSSWSARSAAVRSGCSPPAGPREQAAEVLRAADRPARSCCRARRRCRCWSASSGRTRRAACSA